VIFRSALCAMALIASASPSAQQPAASLYEAVPATLMVSGDVAATSALTIDELRKLSPRTVEDTRAVGGKASNERAPRKYVGVLLRDVLNQVKLKEPEPRGLRKSVVVASARDGYKVVFSWAELYLSPIGDGVYVVYERDGAPLVPAEGPLALVSMADTSPGPRHVKWLQAIDVRMIRD
jgi:DMSO/TMAO reductase YedYZ molybdopterin-dependent catalytic subunit